MDLYQLLVGEAPPEFLIEVFFRSLFIYGSLLIIVRWLGNRMSGQFSISEMAVMLTLGAIVSPPMQAPDRGMLLGIMILLCILLLQRLLHWLQFTFPRFEAASDGRSSLVVIDGVLVLEELKKIRVSRQQLFANLRAAEVFNLGKVERMYLEPSGEFSIFLSKNPRPGLPVLPPDDQNLLNDFKETDENLVACINCGCTVPKQENARCGNCNHDQMVKAAQN